MYRVLLADDEPLIIRGLKKMINWESLNTEVIDTATDGKQLLSIAEKIKPEIIVSDIAMPNLSGLDVIKSIHENHWNTKVIFLSGYQEFNYAKQAITYGAVDYLLKPASKNELERAIVTAENQLSKEKPDKILNKGRNILNFLQKSSKAADVVEKLEAIKNDVEDASFICVCFSLAPRCKRIHSDPNKLAIIRFSVFQFIYSYIKSNNLGIALQYDESRYDTIFVSPKKENPAFIEGKISEIESLVEKNYHVNLSIGVGDAVENISDLKYAYKTTRFAFELNYFQSAPAIFYADVSKDFHQSFENYDDAYEAFFQSVLHKENEWQARLESCFDIIEALHFGNRYAAEDRCISMAISFYRDLKKYKLIDADQDKQAKYEREVVNLRKNNTYKELKSQMIGLFEKLIGTVYQNRSNDGLIIYQVKNYIAHHFSEDITLEKIAGMVYMNPYYFSVFFKRKTGENFKGYLTKVRMEQALIILNRKDAKTAELAKAVGYRDVRTFTDKFKEIYGDSPAGLKKQGHPKQFDK